MQGLLSQVISASSCERNWSAHGHIKTKIRNKLSLETTEKLNYVSSNSKMQARRHRGQSPPFSKLVGKHQDVFPWGGGSAVRTHYGRLSNAPLHLRPSEALCSVHRSRNVPLTAYIGGCFRLFICCGARAPSPDGGGPPGRSLDRPSSSLGRERSSWATLGPSRLQCPREPLS